MMKSIPPQTRRAHLKQSNPLCDTVTVLNMAALTPGRWADMNACRAYDGDLNLHWPESMEKNGFTHIVDKGGLRPMTHEELTRPVSHWKVADALRCRRRVGGVWVRPFTVRERTLQAKWRRVKVAWELKSAQYAAPAAANDFVKELADLSNWCVMTLVTMRYWNLKLRNFHVLGVPTALLAHDAVRPSGLDNWLQWIDRIWGKFHS